MILRNLLILAYLTISQVVVYSQDQKYNQLMSDLRIIKTSLGDHRSFTCFWYETQFLRKSYADQPITTQKMYDRYENAMKNYLVLGYVVTLQETSSSEDGMKEDLFNEIFVVLSNGDTLKPMRQTMVNPIVLEQFELGADHLRSKFDETVQAFDFFFFSVGGKAHLLDPTKSGSFDIFIKGDHVRYELPLASYLPEKKCPQTGTSYRGDYQICPIHGEELQLVPDPPTKLHPMDYFDQALVFLNQGQWEQAIQLSQKGASSDILEFQDYNLLIIGYANMELGKYEEAEAIFDDVMSRKSEHSDELNDFGNSCYLDLYAITENADKACSIIEEQLEQSPNDEQLMLSLVQMYYVKGWNEKAMKMLGEIIELNGYLEVPARIFRARENTINRKNNLVMQDLDKALELEPENPIVYKYYANYYFLNDQRGKGCTCVNKALSLDMSDYGTPEDTAWLKQVRQENCLK